MLKVIIAEKPSVARNIAEAVGAKTRRDGYFEGEDYLITWAFGHLLELRDAREYDEKMRSWRMEHFPFIPSEFRYRVKHASYRDQREDEGAKKQIALIGSLIAREDVDGVVSACDYDREGQIIGDILLDYLGENCAADKPQERILLNEWTPGEVKKGLAGRIPNSRMQPLKDAGISRQWADWIIGINLTSAATLKYQRGWTGKPLNIGRVLLPTLKIIYDRDLEIENFKPEEYSRLLAFFSKEGEEAYEAVYTKEGQERFPDKEALRALAKSLKGKKGEVLEKKVERRKEYPPALFNLSGLQGYITSKYTGWTSEKVLKIAQDLYEKKFITYPRTASTALEESLVSKAEKVLSLIKKGLPYEDEIRFSVSKRVFNNEKVESHSAIIPTYILPKNLSPDEEKVYRAVRSRFLMQFMPPAEYEEGTLITRAGEGAEVFDFVSKGRIRLVEGWKKVEESRSKDKILPAVEIGEVVTMEKNKVEVKSTQPPKKHTEKTLLRTMETCGKKYKEQERKDEEEGEEQEQDEETMKAILSGFSIGTPATRAETIKKLKTAGYIDSKGKSLYATPMGRKLVECFPVKELFDLEYTGRLEKTLSDIEKGLCSKEDFLEKIYAFTREAVEKIKRDDFHIISRGEMSSFAGGKKEVLGLCPGCGGEVIETEKSYSCSGWRSGCKFTIWKEDRFLAALRVQITKEVVRSLLSKGAVYGSRFVNSKGEKFAAVLTYERPEGEDYYRWKIKPL